MEQGGSRTVEVVAVGEERVEAGVEGALVGDALVEQAGCGADVGEVVEDDEGGRVAEVQGRAALADALAAADESGRGERGVGAADLSELRCAGRERKEKGERRSRASGQQLGTPAVAGVIQRRRGRARCSGGRQLGGEAPEELLCLNPA